MNTEVTFNYLKRQKKSFMKKIMTLIFKEVIISVRHTLDEQMYSFLQLFFKTENIRLNLKFDSTVIVALVFIVIPL